MSEGDILHMIIIDETGTATVTVDLQTTPAPGEVINVVPGQAVAKAATAITSSSFTANWNLMENATGYYLDVATDSAFTSYVTGWQNKNMGNTISDSVTGLDLNYPYYYRVRAYNDIGTGISSETVITTTAKLVASDWFLPSVYDLWEMRLILYLNGIGGLFANGSYATSSESSAINCWTMLMSTGQNYAGKNDYFRVRACRSFISTTVYNLRDRGPADGWIFWKQGNNYLETAPSDQSASQAWSNIINVLVGTDTYIGTGQANTTAIINQAGHTDSAAKLCDDLIL